MAGTRHGRRQPAVATTGILRYFHRLSDVSAPPASESNASAIPCTPVVPEENDTDPSNESENDDEQQVTESAPTTAAHVASTPTSHVSDYERKRLARIAMNAQFLQQLGVRNDQMALAVSTTQPPVTRVPSRKRVRREATEDSSIGRSTRRSTRLRGASVSVVHTSIETTAQGSEEEENDIARTRVYDDSSVHRYSCSGDILAQQPSTRHVAGNGKLVGFQQTARGMADPQLRKIYSIAFSPFAAGGLIAAGGHQGQISIYAAAHDTEEDEDQSPLMSFRGHGGWISSLSLEASRSGGKHLLLSAANDGVVKLWDLNQCDAASGVAKELLSVDDLHQNGIFCMDVRENQVLTCSKDSTVAMSTLRGDRAELQVVRRFDEHHGVVKCAAMSLVLPAVFASGGNDCTLRVYDSRLPGSAVVHALENAHPRAINSVVWHPTSEHTLLTASFDPDMHLYDLRRLDQPLNLLNPSVPGARSSAIYHPCFVNRGDYIVSTGATSQDVLSLYRASDGSCVSRGELPGKASYVTNNPWSDELLVAMGQQLRFYSERTEDDPL